MSLPSFVTGPNEVRAYLTRILVSKHDATPDIAQQIANKWGLGRPGDLRLASERYFDRVFGSEIGTFIFRTVQEDIQAEWYASVPGMLTYCTSNLFLLICIGIGSSSS